MNNLTPEKKMVKARAGLILDHPFYGSLALRLTLHEDKFHPGAYTNGKVLGYNSKFISSLTLPQTKGLIAHEVLHVALLHHTRRLKRDPYTWNLAGDHVINDTLLANGFELPPGGMSGDSRGESVDAVYARLYKEQQDEQQGNGRGSGQGQGQSPSQGDPGQPGGQSQGQSGAQSNTGGQWGEVFDGAGDEAGLKKAEEDARIAVYQAATQAKSMGSLPGDLQRMIGEMLNPKVDWREVLRDFVERSSKNDYAWTPPNRRYLSHGVYLPSLHDRSELGDVVIGIDTSGSISQEELDIFASELTGILEEYTATAHVVYCDSGVQGVEVFESQDLPLTMKPRGGGGTAFSPVLRWVDREDMTPACLIYFTDMYCSNFGDEPDYPVLWAKHGSGPDKAPFGEVLTIE